MTTPLNVSEFNPGIGSRPVGTAVSIFNGALHVIGGDGNHNLSTRCTISLVRTPLRGGAGEEGEMEPDLSTSLFAWERHIQCPNC
jgi:hypothetical protein